MREIRNAYKILVEKPARKRDHSEDLDVDGRIILECILGKQVRNVWIEFTWLRIGTIGGFLRTR
jgi:hypothetical protein